MPLLMPIVLTLGLFAAPALALRLVVLVERAADMPFAEFRADQVVGGIHLQLSQMLAERLGLELALKAVPRRRVGPMLDTGQADMACALLPEWLAAEVDWTQPFLPHAGVVITPQTRERPSRISALAKQPIGTIKGYAYRELEQALGRDFVREEAPDAQAMLRMLEIGRMNHASVNLQYLEYRRKLGLFKVPLHPYLFTGAYETRCAVSRRSPLKLEQIDQLITNMRSDGSLQRLLDQYRD